MIFELRNYIEDAEAEGGRPLKVNYRLVFWGFNFNLRKVVVL